MAPAAITISPIARPSSPSVRLTALDAPTTMITTNRKKKMNANAYVNGLSISE